MKFQQFMILLALATLAMVAVGVMGQCGNSDDASECQDCCESNNYMWSTFNRYGCTCDGYGKREGEWLFNPEWTVEDKQGSYWGY